MRLFFYAFFILGQVYSLYAQDSLQTRVGVPVPKLEHPSTRTGDLLPYQKKYAILIGINTYKDSSYTSLKYAAEDAKSMKDLLINKFAYEPAHVKLLLNEEATRVNILQALEVYATAANEQIAENAQLLVYFAGHGRTLGRNDNPVGYLLTYDSDRNSPMSTSIRMTELRDVANQMVPKHVLFLVDACYGGLSTSRSAAESAYTDIFVRNIWNQKGREIITAGSANEEVIESDDWKHSAFMHVLLDGLGNGKADANQDNLIFTKELSSYIMSRVPYYADQKGGKQTPKEGAYTPDSGTFIFELAEGRVAEALQSNARFSDRFNPDVFKSILKVNANVDQARVFINDKEIGHTSDKKLEHRLAPGLYTLTIKKDKYTLFRQDIELKPDEDLNMEANLERETTLTKFSLNPPNTSLTINNELIGTGSLQKEFKKGRYLISLDAPGYKPIINTPIDLTQEEQSFAFELEKIVAVLEIYSIPNGAAVKLKDKDLGQTPLNIELGYGEHVLVFSKKDYALKNVSFVVKESGVKRETINLEKTPEKLARTLYYKDLIGHAKKFVLRGATAYGLYQYGYPWLTKLYDQEPDANKKNSLKYLRFAPLAIGGTFAISSIAEIVRIIKMDYNTYLENVLRNPKVSVRLAPEVHGLSVAMQF